MRVLFKRQIVNLSSTNAFWALISRFRFFFLHFFCVSLFACLFVFVSSLGIGRIGCHGNRKHRLCQDSRSTSICWPLKIKRRSTYLSRLPLVAPKWTLFEWCSVGIQCCHRHSGWRAVDTNGSLDSQLCAAVQRLWVFRIMSPFVRRMCQMLEFWWGKGRKERMKEKDEDWKKHNNNDNENTHTHTYIRNEWKFVKKAIIAEKYKEYKVQLHSIPHTHTHTHECTCHIHMHVCNTHSNDDSILQNFYESKVTHSTTFS